MINFSIQFRLKPKNISKQDYKIINRIFSKTVTMIMRNLKININYN